MTNIEIATLISERIGQRPVPFEAVRTLALEIYHDLGGREDDENFADIFEILLSILPLTNLIDDTSIYLDKTWSSYKIDASLNQVITTLDGKQDVLTAGNNITINGTTISAKDTTYSASDNIDITDNAIKAVGYRYDTTNGAFAEGDRDIVKDGTTYPKSTATGIMSHAEGNNTTASGAYSHAEGYNTIASGAGSHAGGYSNKSIIDASGAGSFAHGHASNGSISASSKGAVAIGCATGVGTFKGIIKASGQGAHAEGFASRGTIDASGNGAHAEGYNTAALANGAHAEGRNTTASGDYSHAEGFHTEANNQSEHASGKYNKSNKQDANAQTIFSIGVGTSKTDRKNAIEVLRDGRVYITGIGGYDGTNPFDSSSLQDFLSSLSGGGNA